MEVTYLVKDNLRRIVKLYVGYSLRTKLVDLYLKLYQEAKNPEDLDQLAKELPEPQTEEEKALVERLKNVHEEFKTLLGR